MFIERKLSFLLNTLGGSPSLLLATLSHARRHHAELCALFKDEVDARQRSYAPNLMSARCGEDGHNTIETPLLQRRGDLGPKHLLTGRPFNILVQYYVIRR